MQLLLPDMVCRKSVFIALFATFVIIPNVSDGTICLPNTWLVGGLEDIFFKFKNMLADILWIIVIRVLNLFQLGPGLAVRDTLVILLCPLFGWMIMRLVTMGFIMHRRMIKKANKNAKLRTKQHVQKYQYPYDVSTPKRKKRYHRGARTGQEEPLLYLINKDPIRTSNRFHTLQCL